MRVRILVVLAAAMVMSVISTDALDREGLIALAAESWSQAQAEAAIQRAQGSDPELVALVTGIVRHNLAVKDPGHWAEAAIAALEPCAHGNDAVGLGYYGSALTLRARLASQKGDLIGATMGVQQGWAKLDDALKAAPDSLLLRFLRAENVISVGQSSPFKRWKVAEADLDRITGAQATLSLDERAHLELLRGRLALAKGDTNEGMRRMEAAIRMAPNSTAAADAKAALADYEE